MPFVRSPHNYDSDIDSFKSGLECLDPTRAQQNMRDETDINVLVKRFAGGMPIPAPAAVAEFVDASAGFDFQQAMNQVVEAQRAFMDLPSNIRDRFANDPAKLIDFLADGRNQAEAAFLGLAATTPPPAPAAAPVGAPVGSGEPPKPEA